MPGKGVGMIEKELCCLTKQLMLRCLGGHSLGEIQEIAGFFTNNSIVIGSRSEEFYTSVEQIKNDLHTDKGTNGRNYICRPVKEWFQSISLSEKVFLVCGNVKFELLFVSGKEEEPNEDSRTGLWEKEVRISVVWKEEERECSASAEAECPNKFRVAHIHLSLPEEDAALYRKPVWNAESCEEYPPGGQQREAAYYRKLSERDLITGLYNRGSFERYVKRRLNEAGGGTFYMIDLDDFKAVNDTYGHVAGDRVIMGMAEILREVFGEEAVIGRLGGDEFAVFENKSDTRKEAEEKARKAMEAYRTMSGRYGNEVVLSCSIGLYREKGNETFENLYSRADEALYFSKNSYKGTFHWYYRQGRS